MSLQTREFEAEAVAHLVSQRLHVDIGAHVYLSGYLSGDATLPAYSLEAVLKATHMVEEMTAGLVRVKKEKIDSKA